MIPKDFVKHYTVKRRDLAKDPTGPQIKMSLGEYWAKWEPYWHLRQNGPNTLPVGETMVMGRLGDTVITQSQTVE